MKESLSCKKGIFRLSKPSRGTTGGLLKYEEEIPAADSEEPHRRPKLRSQLRRPKERGL